MAGIEIDLRTRVCGSQQRIYILFPGAEYGFVADFQKRSVVYLDAPALALAERIPPLSDPDFAARLKMSEQVARWHATGARPADEPSRRLADYTGSALGQRRGLFGGQVAGLYHQFQKGDLLVVRAGKGFYADVMFGELVDDPTPRVSISVPSYPEETIIARRVNWLRQVPKYRLGPELHRRMSTPNALTLLDRSFWEDVLSVTYENYVFNGDYSARFLTTAQSFSSLDSATINAFLTIIAAATASFEENETVADGELDFDAALSILQRYPEYAADLKININSPGDIAQRNSFISPLVSAVMLAAAISGASNAHAGEVRVINNGVQDQTSIHVDARVAETMRMMGYNRWQNLCAAMQSCHTRTGLKTPAQPTHKRVK